MRPERRAGIGQIFLNDLDDTISDVRWIKDHNLRGGILLPTIPPDVDWIKPLNHPDYDRLWAVCEELEVPVNSHGGTGSPAYERVPSSALLMISETGFFSRRPFLFLLLSGVFERFPNLSYVMTEQGSLCIVGVLEQLDDVLAKVRTKGAIGELRFKAEHIRPKSATEYFHQNCWVGASFPRHEDAAAFKNVLGVDKCMWGSDYPHDEGTFPFTTSRCARCSTTGPRPTCARSWPRTRPRCTASTSRPSRRRRPKWARRSQRSPARSIRCPKTPTKPSCATSPPPDERARRRVRTPQIQLVCLIRA